MTIRVLGVDLASSTWRSNGSAVLTIEPRDRTWVAVEPAAVQWPAADALTPETMATAIAGFVRQHGIHAVSLDGPQGWREPDAAPRAGVGRWCEYEARTQGKVGVYGRAYPGTQFGWISFCIHVFERLRLAAGVRLANDPTVRGLEVGDEPGYWLLECFPTSTWRAANLRPLPGKRATRADEVQAYAAVLWQRFGLPGPPPISISHDDLQAVVAALPAAALLGGPCVARANGLPGRYVAPTTEPRHWVEGVIWDATPPAEAGDQELDGPEIQRTRPTLRSDDANNPCVIDERDEYSDQLLERGVELFQYLVSQANAGRAIGVGYKQFVSLVHDAPFETVFGRGWSQAHVPYVLDLAAQVTARAGSRAAVARQDTCIQAGMDSFIWRVRRPYTRHRRAFAATPYTAAAWRAVLPDGLRQILQTGDAPALFSPAGD